MIGNYDTKVVAELKIIVKMYLNALLISYFYRCVLERNTIAKIQWNLPIGLCDYSVMLIMLYDRAEKNIYVPVHMHVLLHLAVCVHVYTL